jgi:Tfp pilus assembly protein PilF
MRLARDGDVEGVHQAFDLIARIGAETPDTLDNLATLAVSLHHRRHDETSELLCRRLLEESERVLDKDHVQTLTYLENLAFLNMFQGHLEEAEEHFQRALQSRLASGGCEQSGTLSTLSSLAECLLLRGSGDAARQLIRDHAARLPADNAFQSARPMLARCLSGSGMQLKNEFSAFEAARICYELSLEIEPNSAVTHNNIALLLWVCLNNPGEARDHFRESLRLLPSDGTTHSNYGHLLAQTMNLPAEAAQHFTEARRLSPNEGGILGNYAALLIQQGDLAAAWAVLERSVRLCLPQPDRTMARAYFGAAAVLLLRGGDPSLPLGQLKTLFAHGIDYVPWVVTAMLDALDRKLPRNSYELMRAVADAISHKESLARLEDNPAWRDLKAVPLDAQWPPFR